MTVYPLNQHIEQTPGIVGGQPRIAGRRVTVQQVAFWHEREGRTADEIAADYDLTLADVYAALTYYFDHRAEIDQSATDSLVFAESLRGQFPTRIRQTPGEPSGDGNGNPVLH